MYIRVVVVVVYAYMYVRYYMPEYNVRGKPRIDRARRLWRSGTGRRGGSIEKRERERDRAPQRPTSSSYNRIISIFFKSINNDVTTTTADPGANARARAEA